MLNPTETSTKQKTKYRHLVMPMQRIRALTNMATGLEMPAFQWTHLSFLSQEEPFQIENGNRYTVFKGWRCRKSWQPSVKTVNYRGRVDEQRQSQNLRIIKGIEFGK
ncbi:MAG: hypothetical protein KI793_20215 [Rivularia sp. (in: Bacteria)]|nr:hypothetical protein [Rivularia sp. MS3]